MALPVSIRLTPELKDSLNRLAEADRRSLSNYIEIVLDQHVRDRDENKPRPMKVSGGRKSMRRIK